MIPLSLSEYAVMLTTMVVAAAVQASVGFGANLIAVPVLAILEPRALPVAATLWALPLNVSMAVRERDGIDWRGALTIVAWRIPGTIVGAFTVAAVRADTIAVLSGAAVLVGVAMTAGYEAVPINRWTTAAAGLASGAMGTATSIGGPPLALLYQGSSGAVLRSTLAVTLVPGVLMAFAAQAAAGVAAAWHAVLALSMLPGIAAGLVLGRVVAGHLEGPRLQRAVHTLAAAAALLAIGRGLA